MRPSEVVKRLKADGWIKLPGGKTSHKQFKHSTKTGKVMVPNHPGDINPVTLNNIATQSGVSMN